MNALRLLNPTLWDLCQPYHATEEQMPWAYQIANPAQRQNHGDWGIVTGNPVLKALQPWQKLPRRDFAFRVPAPFRILEGQKQQNWYPLDPNYPLSPGAVVETRPYTTVGGTYAIPHVLVDDAVDGGGWTTYEAYFPHVGEWRPVYRRYSCRVFGRMLKYYGGVGGVAGLKLDTTVDVKPDGTLVSDVMAWYGEISMTLNKVMP